MSFSMVFDQRNMLKPRVISLQAMAFKVVLSAGRFNTIYEKEIPKTTMSVFKIR